jgi:hypothetical protein
MEVSMRRSAIVGIFMIVPALLVLTAAPGCGKKDGGGGKKGGEVVSGKKSAPEDKKGGETASGSSGALKAKLDAVVKGQVTYDGDPPAVSPIAAMSTHKDKDVCLMGKDFEKSEQQWIVNKSNNGVANVVISLEPPAGSYFNLREEDKKPKDVTVDQPHCAFIPHVVALFPVYLDGDKKVPTGQKLIVHNSAPVQHNTKVVGSATANPQRSLNVPPNATKEFPIKWQKNPIDIGCDFHPWMNAKALTFDNPYHAVTDLDGKYTIENVPSGVELTVVVWHEVPGRKTDKQTFKTGDNTYNAKVSK